MIETKPWNKILDFYLDLQGSYNWDIQPMIDLISSINKSSYKKGIHGYTSHEILFVGQYEALVESNALLKIQYLSQLNQVIFNYKGDMTTQFTWEKKFDKTQIITEFERFIHELKWVV